MKSTVANEYILGYNKKKFIWSEYLNMSSVKNSHFIVDNQIIRENIKCILGELMPGCSLVPVVKDDAYQFGLLNMGRIISEFDEIEYAAVAHVSEGLALREDGFNKKILVLGNPLPHLIENAIDTGLELSLSGFDIIPRLVEIGKSASLQIEINSGLNRTGISPCELGPFAEILKKLPNFIKISGIYSHFSSHGSLETFKREYSVFKNAVDYLEASGISLPMKHISSSASFELSPEYNLDAVRIGRRLYMDAPGVYNGAVREAGTWQAYITGIYSHSAGEALGYESTYILKRDSKLASISVGYGDGLNQKLVSVHAPVLINGSRCSLLAGFMDQAIADVTGIDCSVGSKVTLFGYDEFGNVLPSQEAALLIGDDEGCGLTSALSGRVERVYIN